MRLTIRIISLMIFPINLMEVRRSLLSSKTVLMLLVLQLRLVLFLLVIFSKLLEAPINIRCLRMQESHQSHLLVLLSRIHLTSELLQSCGGVIVSVGSTEGFGYQPLVAAGGTAAVSIAGTIQSISIGNSGSGYRPGAQTVNVGVATTSLTGSNRLNIGTASISGGHIVSVAITNPGTGYTSTEPPVVIFDDPISYSDIPLVYSSSSSGNGSGAKASVNMRSGYHEISFNSQIEAGEVTLSTSVIGISTYHKFRNAERIIYNPDGQQAIGGITTDGSYLCLQCPIHHSHYTILKMMRYLELILLPSHPSD